jgi:hypothetical protein
MPSAKLREPVVPARVKTAVEYLLTQKADLQLAAAAAGISMRELRRSLGQPHVHRYMAAEKQRAIEVLCLGNVAALQKVRDESENAMARVGAVKTAEMMRVGALADEAASQQRRPGLQIVLVQKDGTKELVPMSPPSVPLIDITPRPEPEIVPQWDQNVPNRDSPQPISTDTEGGDE